MRFLVQAEVCWLPLFGTYAVLILGLCWLALILQPKAVYALFTLTGRERGFVQKCGRREISWKHVYHRFEQGCSAPMCLIVFIPSCAPWSRNFVGMQMCVGGNPSLEKCPGGIFFAGTVL